jgi:hypothetical protein
MTAVLRNPGTSTVNTTADPKPAPPSRGKRVLLKEVAAPSPTASPCIAGKSGRRIAQASEGSAEVRARLQKVNAPASCGMLLLEQDRWALESAGARLLPCDLLVVAVPRTFSRIRSEGDLGPDVSAGRKCPRGRSKAAFPSISEAAAIKGDRAGWQWLRHPSTVNCLPDRVSG